MYIGDFLFSIYPAPKLWGTVVVTTDTVIHFIIIILFFVVSCVLFVQSVSVNNSRVCTVRAAAAATR